MKVLNPPQKTTPRPSAVTPVPQIETAVQGPGHHHLGKLQNQTSFMRKSFLRPLRKFVSGNRNRLKESGFDLDLTYITSRVIAMAFPASGLEAAYRNPRDQVIAFLQQHHPDKYQVFNLCSEDRSQYDLAEFSHCNSLAGAVSIPIKDHTVPSLYQMASFAQQALTWLSQHEDNVVVVHCLAGKGRTGLMVSALLVAGRMCGTAAEALELFNSLRSADSELGDGGVKIPSQIRWVKLFEEMLALASYSVPISITSLGLAKFEWTLKSIDLGPTRAAVQSVSVRPRSDKEPTELALPLLLKQKVFPPDSKVQVVHVDLGQTCFASHQDAHFSIRLKKSGSLHRHHTVKFWFPAEMTQTMINHRLSGQEDSTLFLSSEELDSPDHPDKVLGYRSSGSAVDAGLPSERFFVKVNVKFRKLVN